MEMEGHILKDFSEERVSWWYWLPQGGNLRGLLDKLLVGHCVLDTASFSLFMFITKCSSAQGGCFVWDASECCCDACIKAHDRAAGVRSGKSLGSLGYGLGSAAALHASVFTSGTSGLGRDGWQAEMQKVIKIAEINFWPNKISTKKWPKNDPKWPKMTQNCQNGPKITQNYN